MTRLTKSSLFIVAAFGLLNVLWMFFGDFGFVWGDLLNPVIGVLILLSISAFYSSYRPVEDFAVVTLWTAILIAFSVVAALSSYLMASLHFSFKDEYMAAFDNALGFDWVALLELVGRDAELGKYATAIYSASLPLLALTLIFLGLTGRSGRLELFVSSLIFACFATIALSGPMVAIGPYGHYNIPAELYQEFAPAVTTQGEGSLWLSHVMGLREGSYKVLSLADLQGVITFPSFHTVMSVLMILALRGCGAIFWISAVLNVLILLTVPLDGNHYFADMVAGGLIAVLVWYALSRFQRSASPNSRRESAQIPVPAMVFGPG